MPTVDCYAERFEVGKTTQPYRATATAIVVAVEGEGSTRVGTKEFTWRKNDIFTLPRWQWIEHTATSGPASLFLMTDRAFVASIGHFREERQDAAGVNGIGMRHGSILPPRGGLMPR